MDLHFAVGDLPYQHISPPTVPRQWGSTAGSSHAASCDLQGCCGEDSCLISHLPAVGHHFGISSRAGRGARCRLSGGGGMRGGGTGCARCAGDNGLAAVLQMAHLFLEMPAWEVDAMERAKSLYMSHYRALPKSLERASADRIMNAMMGQDRRGPRRPLPSPCCRPCRCRGLRCTHAVNRRHALLLYSPARLQLLLHFASSLACVGAVRGCPCIHKQDCSYCALQAAWHVWEPCKLRRTTQALPGPYRGGNRGADAGEDAGQHHGAAAP